MLLKIKPDVILQELDTTLMDDQGNYKSTSPTKGNEGIASAKYKQVNGSVVFRRFDIADRNIYYSKNHTFAMEDKVDKAVDSLWKGNLLAKGDMQIMSAMNNADRALNVMDDMDIYTLNSTAYLNFAAYRQDWMYNKELEVIAHTPALKQYYAFYKEDGNFWIRRNNAMVNNIAGYLKTFKGKNIVVLTGSMHKYFLTKELTPLQDKLSFKLKNLP